MVIRGKRFSVLGGILGALVCYGQMRLLEWVEQQPWAHDQAPWWVPVLLLATNFVIFGRVVTFVPDDPKSDEQDGRSR